MTGFFSPRSGEQRNYPFGMSPNANLTAFDFVGGAGGVGAGGGGGGEGRPFCWTGTHGPGVVGCVCHQQEEQQQLQQGEEEGGGGGGGGGGGAV